MSLGIGIKGPEGIVLAAESRVTLQLKKNGNVIFNNYDNATKLLTFNGPNTSIGAVTYGLATIGQRTAHSFLPEFESQLPDERLTVEKFAEKLGEFYLQQWQQIMPRDYKGPSMTFVVAGFNENEPYGRIYIVELPSKPKPIEQTDGMEQFGVVWGGQREIVDRLIQGYDSRLLPLVSSILKPTEEQSKKLEETLLQLNMQIAINAMALQDCVDLAIFLIRTTIDGQKLTTGVRGCGGPIDVAIITRRDSLQYVQKKEISGEKE